MCNQQSLISACAYDQSDRSHCYSLELSMTVKLLIEHHLEFLSLKGGFKGSLESTNCKMQHCWKSPVAVHIMYFCYCLTYQVLYRQIVGIPMGTNCAPLVADLFLFML